MPDFVDRERELRALEERLRQPSSLSLVFGQRRTGKTFLLRRVLRDERSDVLFFVGDESTTASLLRRFVEEARGAGWLTQAGVAYDWSTALTLLLQEAALEHRRLILVLDECQYLFDADPALPSVLQRLWDTWKDRVGLHIVLCGSALGALAALGEAGQPLHGRFDLRMKLPPFSYREAALFAPAWAPVQRLLLYGVFGGLARHLAAIDDSASLDENVAWSILDPLGRLHDAAIDVLRSERLSSRAEADAVLAAVASGETSYSAITARAGLTGPRTDAVLKELQDLEIIRRDARFGDRPGARFARYRIADPFVAFWFRLVRPNRGALLGSPPEEVFALRIASRLDDWMGPVMEEIARQAFVCGHLSELVGLADEALPYWTRDGQTDIDLVVRSGQRVWLVECKWHAHSALDFQALRQLRDHAARFRPGRVPQKTGLCLVSAGGFSDRLQEVARLEEVLLVDARDLVQ